MHITANHQAPLPAPAQLPAPGLFAGRGSDLAELDRLSRRSADAARKGLVVITGQGGVGKTALALHWLHLVKADYEGQLFVDLRGFAAGEPLASGEPLERFLRALGAEAIPAEVDEQAALFRSMTAGRRLIIMLDNAVSAAQVRPLLPGSGPALIVVTARRRLTGLLMNGAQFLDLDPLGMPGALELLSRLAGPERIGAEPEQARALLRLCGLLPLAICASGARLAARRRWPISRVVAELGDETHRLSTLHAGEEDMSVHVVLNASYQALDDRQAHTYRLLGLHPGTDFGVEAAAALIAADHCSTARLLDELVDASLLLETPCDRYRFHDLVRLHAHGKALEADSEAERNAAVARLADWYLTTAVAADLAILPGRWHLGRRYAPDHRSEIADRGGFSDRTAALDWFEREQANLVAVARQAHRSGLHDLTWQLCEAMWPLFLQRKHYRAWIEAYELGLEAAGACADPRAEARMLEGLGMAYLNLQDFAAARDRYASALTLELRAGHRLGEAAALEGLGIAELATGHETRAIELFTRARDVHRDLGRPRGIALMSRHVGEALGATGHHAEAIEDLTSALEFFTEAGEPYHRARTLTCLGQAQLRAGRPDEAAAVLAESLALTRRTAARHEEANVLSCLAGVAAHQNDPAAERHYLEQALALYCEVGAPQVEAVRNRLAELPPTSPDRPAAGPPS